MKQSRKPPSMLSKKDPSGALIPINSLADKQARMRALETAGFRPSAPTEQGILDAQISLRIFLIAREQLKNEADREALRCLFENLHSGVVPQTRVKNLRLLMQAFDAAICEQARDIGMRVFLSRLTYSRICGWEYEPNGPALHKRLGNALALHIGISRGEKKAPINPRLKPYREEFISEVKKLQRLLKSRFPEASLPTRDKIRSVAVELISNREYRLFHLRVNLQTVLQFDAGDVDLSYLRLPGLVNGTTSPAVFVDALIARSTNRSPEALRQAVTKL